MIRTDRFLIAFIFLLGTAAGLFCLSFGPDFPIAESDAQGYDTLAVNLANGKGFSLDGIHPTARDVPGYPFFLAGIYKIFGHNYDAVRAIQALLLGGIGVLIYLIGRRHLGFGSHLAALPAALVTVWPYFVLYTTLILTEILYTFLLILAILFLLELHKSFSKKSVLISGLGLGMAALTRHMAFFLPLWLIFFWLPFFKKERKEIFKKHLLVFLVFLLVFAPWSARNFIHFHFPFPTSQSIFRTVGSIFFEKYAENSYLEPLTKNPAGALTSRLKNLAIFWNPGAGGTRAQTLLETYPQIKFVFLIYKIIFFLLLFSAFLSLFYIKKEAVFLLWSVIFYFWILHAVVFPYPRYTLPIIPLVILLALFSQVKFWTSLKARSEICPAKS